MADVERNEKLEQAVVRMSEMAKSQPDSQKALHYSQAALNLAHTKAILDGADLNREQVKKSMEAKKV